MMLLPVVKLRILIPFFFHFYFWLEIFILGLEPSYPLAYSNSVCVMRLWNHQQTGRRTTRDVGFSSQS